MSLTRSAIASLGQLTTQTSPSKVPRKLPQREPKRPKATHVRSANLRGAVCGALAPVFVEKGITECAPSGHH